MPTESRKLELQNVPAELRASHRWLVWKKSAQINPKTKKFGKEPYDLKTGHLKDRREAARYSLQEVGAAIEAGQFSGVGLFSSGRLIGIDFDLCVEGGKIVKPEVQAALAKLQSYTEISPSETGIRVWVLGDAPRDPKKGDKNPLGLNKLAVKEDLIEIYPDSPSSNFLTVTGWRVPEYPAEVRDLSAEEIGWLYSLAGKRESGAGESPSVLTEEKYALLLAGKLGEAGFDDPSRADQSLCSHLAKKGLARDEVRQIWLSSGLKREKLDRADYIKATLDLAFKDVKARPSARKLFLKTGLMSEIKAETLVWLERGVLLAAALNLFVGNPGIGKTLRAIVSIAIATKAGKKVVVICREDDYGTIWKPRLEVAGADLHLVVPVFGVGDENDPDYDALWMLDDAVHLGFLRQLIEEHSAALCVIDPLADFAGSKDLNKAQDVRDITTPLNKIGKQTGCAMLVTTHTTKALIDSAVKSAAGSMQLMAAVQVSYLFVADPRHPEHGVMAQARNKYGKKRSFKYEKIGVSYPGIEDGVALWTILGEDSRSADELLETALDKENGVKKQIGRWLAEMLKNGPVTASHANQEMNAREFNKKTVSSVCKEMGIKCDGKSWSLESKQSEIPIKENATPF
jgi:AAA domain